MNRNSILVDCHQDIAYSVRANRRLFEENIDKLMISHDSLVNSNIDIIFSTIFVSHRRRDAYYDEALSQIKLYENIFKKYKNFYHLTNKKFHLSSFWTIFESTSNLSLQSLCKSFISFRCDYSKLI